MSDLLSSAICWTIAVISLLVAVEVLPDDVVVLPDALGIVLVQTACSCGDPSLYGRSRYWVMQTTEV